MARTTPIHSGYTIVNGTGSGPNGGRINVWIEYQEQSSITDNSSHVKAYFYTALKPDSSSETNGNDGCTSSFSVNGVSGTNLKRDGSYDFRDTTPILLGTYEGDIGHNTDGTKSISIRGSFTTSSTWITGGSVSGTVTLTKIPRGILHTNVGGTWKTAMTYANVGGTWKLTQVYGNVSGVWKQSC